MDKETIERESENAKEKWGYPCLKNGTELKYDIGEKVYFASGGNVLKGVICSVNPFGMAMIKFIPDKDGSKVCWNLDKCYKNVEFALRDADYHWETKEESKENLSIQFSKEQMVKI